MRRHDYLPFGEELTASVGAQRSGVGYEPPLSNVRQKFASKERDIETGLDYFGARYFASVQGRFTSTDSEGPELLNPQTLNKYRYCLNNPLRYIDQDGKYEEDVHRDLTRVLALAAGFDSRSAKNIATWDQATDEEADKEPMGMLPFGKPVERRENWHFTTPERRQELWDTFWNEPSERELGYFLHT